MRGTNALIRKSKLIQFERTLKKIYIYIYILIEVVKKDMAILDRMKWRKIIYVIFSN